MVAFQYRMGGGIPGDINRTHPASVEACLVDPTNPPTAFGIAVLPVSGSNGVRMFGAGDTAVTRIWGITARPYPFQAQSATNFGAQNLGSATPPTNQPIDVMRMGYISVQLPAGQAVTKGSAVYVWCAASTGSHVQGGFEGAASGGNTAALDSHYAFNGPADANGVAEISIST